MEKPVIISIKGTQTTEPGQEDVMELVTQGTLRGESGDFTVSYLESELTGLDGTTTTFHIEPDQITLTREGTLNSVMVFQVGKRHYSPYQTPFGGIILGVNTQKAFSDMSETGGNISIRYIMEVENERVSENAFDIQVSEPTAGTLPLRQ
ncbi:MAG: DUF1934 domain-containing protein [Ruminiclostridium sp.]|nr:DUF1934 domain-containing protein [Ruminiclostridium sp.]